MLTIEDQNQGSPVFNFSGALGISSIQEIYQVLKKSDLSFSGCRLLISNVDSIDLCFFQLVYAFGMKLKGLGKEVSFEFVLDEEYQRIFQRSGLENAFGKLLEK